MEFSRQEQWSRLPFFPSRYLPDPGIKPTSPVAPALAGEFFLTELPGNSPPQIFSTDRQQNLHLEDV